MNDEKGYQRTKRTQMSQAVYRSGVLAVMLDT